MARPDNSRNQQPIDESRVAEVNTLPLDAVVRELIQRAGRKVTAYLAKIDNDLALRFLEHGSQPDATCEAALRTGLAAARIVDDSRGFGTSGQWFLDTAGREEPAAMLRSADGPHALADVIRAARVFASQK